MSELIERALKLYVQHHAKRRGKVDLRASVSAAEGADIGGQASENMGKPADKNRNRCSTREKGNRSVKADTKAQKAAIATRNRNPGTDRRTTDATSPCRQSSSEWDVQAEMGAAPESGRPEEQNLAPAFKRKYPASLPRPPVSIHLKRAIWTRASAQCEFKNDQGHRCPAKRALEMDHRLPVSLGGASSEKNLQLLCRMHNQIKGQRINSAMILY